MSGPLDNECPACGAKAGHHCSRPPHSARIEKAARAQELPDLHSALVALRDALDRVLGPQ